MCRIYTPNVEWEKIMSLFLVILCITGILTWIYCKLPKIWKIYKEMSWLQNSWFVAFRNEQYFHCILFCCQTCNKIFFIILKLVILLQLFSSLEQQSLKSSKIWLLEVECSIIACKQDLHLGESWEITGEQREKGDANARSGKRLCRSLMCSLAARFSRHKWRDC